MHSPRPLDDIDIKLLEVLQERGRTKSNVLAEITGLSVPAVSERLKKLEESGCITGYHATVDPRRLGFDVTAFIGVSVDSSKHYRAFLDKVEVTPEVAECHAVTGEGTHLLKVRARNTEELEKLLSTIQSWHGVVRTMTRVVLSSPKETMAVPVSKVKPGENSEAKVRVLR
jgi:Lrp/AsnC family leucine-responsive transcriptional regulator